MNGNSFRDGPERVRSAWAAPKRYLGLLIAQCGYALPSFDGLEWHRVGDPISDNWAVTEHGISWGDRRDISISTGSKGNVIVYGTGSRAIGRHTIWGHNNLVVFGEHNAQSARLDVYINGNDTLTFVGNRTSCNNGALFNQGSGTRLIVGEDCMLSHGIVIRTSDDHSIIDMQSGVQLNPIQDTVIEPYVWLCPEAHIHKGVCVGFGSVVAERAVVANDVGRFQLVGGVPARVLREHVSWDRPAVPRADRHQVLTNIAKTIESPRQITDI